MDPINVTAEATEFTSNAYLVPGAEPALVDVGSMDGVVEVVREHVDDLARVALTHQHVDHVAELDAVVDAFDLAVAAYNDHELRTDPLDDGDAIRLGDDEYEVVYTPGHAADHVAFVGEERLFSGDVVVYNDAAFENGSFGKTENPGQSRERLIESLHTLLDRTPETVTELYAGHGDVYDAEAGDDTVHEVIERALERAERREPKYPGE